LSAPLHVLLVEDHTDTRRAMQRILTHIGCQVSAAATVREALDLADQLHFDLLVCDIGLPDGTGIDIMKHVRPRGLRGIAVSGYSREEDIERSREAGFEMHLIKPIDFKTLEDALRRLAM
jgi:CheY-like chemotaxis protein